MTSLLIPFINDRGYPFEKQFVQPWGVAVQSGETGSHNGHQAANRDAKGKLYVVSQ